MAQTRTGGRILVDQLIAQGCDRIFQVPGESFLAVLDALTEVDAIDLVTCRQEGGAAFMADADARLSGRPGVAFVTRGPGATNASIGVHVARQDSIPLILFVGDVARPMRDREGFQEVDLPAMFAPLAKWTARIDSAERIPEYVARAYATAMSGRPGPVVLALPEDMLTDEVEATDRPRVEPPVQPACADAMMALDALLKEATDPVVIAGGAGWTPKTAHHLRQWAERLGLPVATAFRRQDAIDNASPVYAGNLGYGPNPKLVERVKAADLILAVGPRLGEATTDGYELITLDHPDQRLVHVHPDPEELNSVYRADLPICAEVSEFAEQADLWESDALSFDAGAQAHAEWRAWSTPEPGGFDLDMASCLAVMRTLCPGDAILCNGAGNFSGWWHRYWHYAGPGTQLAPTAGAMGYGVPAAVAAARRRPDRLVVALAGDGDMLMNGQELATAAKLGLSLLVIVVDNGGYGTIRMHQERDYPARVSGTQLVNPDFAALGRAYGAWAATVERTDEFEPALRDALDRTGLRLLHLRIDMNQLAAGGLTVDRLRERASG